MCMFSPTIDTGQSSDQLKLQNQLTQTELAQQKEIRDQITGAFGKYLNGDIGFSPEQMSILTSQFLNQNTGAFDSAGSNVRSALAARGSGAGDLPLGGDYARGIAELEGAKASSQSQGLLGLGAQNLQQALTNRFNAGNLMAGQAAQTGQNISVFNQGAGNALSNSTQAMIGASNNSFGTAFGKAFGGSLGKGWGGTFGGAG